MCRIHGTECLFRKESEQGEESNRSPTALRGNRKRAARRRVAPIAPIAPIATPISTGSSIMSHGASAATALEVSSSADPNPWAGQMEDEGGGDPEGDEEQDYQPTPLSLDDTEQENTHIVGPANTADSQVLADYLSAITTDNGGMRMVRLMPGNRSKPVLFSTIQKRPVGVEVNTNQAREKLYIIEQFLAPYSEQLIEM